jgi:hypothetical protein
VVFFGNFLFLNGKKMEKLEILVFFYYKFNNFENFEKSPHVQKHKTEKIKINIVIRAGFFSTNLKRYGTHLSVFYFWIECTRCISNGLLTKHIHLNLRGFKSHMQLAQRTIAHLFTFPNLIPLV